MALHLHNTRIAPVSGKFKKYILYFIIAIKLYINLELGTRHFFLLHNSRHEGLSCHVERLTPNKLKG